MLIHTPRLKGRRSGVRAGLTLTEVVVTVAILAILATVVTRSFVNSSRVGGDARRIDQAATTLAKLADASSRNSLYRASLLKETSFSLRMVSTGSYNPSRLSYLTDRPASTAKTYCGTTYTSTTWKYPFYNRIIPPTGLLIAEGFFAEDATIRFDSTGTNSTTMASLTTSGFMAIVMKNVTLGDAEALRTRVEGLTSESNVGSVRFDDTLDPTTVYYYWNIHGC
jgi:prepilin-type N-terminal cleavage/methylation domain-containing protein